MSREPTPDQLAEARSRGFIDGFYGRAVPEVHASLLEAYASGRRIGTHRSGRLPVPGPPLFGSAFCREVLGRVITKKEG